jgi:hypothetical protein
VIGYRQDTPETEPSLPITKNQWVGHIPGKRESRRFEGDYMLRQQDIVEQRLQADAVSFGGWALDLHPADGVYSYNPGLRPIICTAMSKIWSS